MCHKNAPVVNRLYNVIQGDSALAKDVKSMAIAFGNDQKQINAFKTQYSKIKSFNKYLDYTDWIALGNVVIQGFWK